MTYEEVVQALQTLCEVPLNNSDENFQRILPTMFLYADGRIYRDFAFLATTTTQPAQFVANNREFVLPTNVRALRGINVCTPVGSITFTSKRNPLTRIPPDVLDVFWPQASFKPGMPEKYAIVGSVVDGIVEDRIVRLMPTPNQNFPAELLGDVRPLPLSPENPETYLTIAYPELFICACMIFAAGYQRDFGAQADDPQRAVSWEGQYNYFKPGISLEAARMRGEGPGFTAAVPAPAAQPRAP